MISQSGSSVNGTYGQEFAKPSFVAPTKSANTVTIQQKQPNGTLAPTGAFTVTQAQAQATGTLQFNPNEMVDSDGQLLTNG
jgi:hypothetical protein